MTLQDFIEKLNSVVNESYGAEKMLVEMADGIPVAAPKIINGVVVITDQE